MEAPALPFTALLLLLAGVLIGMSLLQHWIERQPLSTSTVYLAVGAAAAALTGMLTGLPPGSPAGAPNPLVGALGTPAAVLATEAVVLVSLFTVGLRLRQLAWRAWRLALLLAVPGMVVTIALASVAAAWLLALPWLGALVLATILAPTDPVLASEVQMRSPRDRDAVRLSLSAEGGLNDGTALPVMMLALGLLGSLGSRHDALGPWGLHWLLRDVLWPIGGGALLGWLLGRALDFTLRALLRRGHRLAWDELLHVGIIALAFGLARATATSTFIVMFAAGVALFWRPALPHAPAPGEAPCAPSGPASDPAAEGSGRPLDERLVAFGVRCERLLEVFMVLALGAMLVGPLPSVQTLAFALLFIVLVRPLAVVLVLRRSALPATQRRLIAWFGVRGVGSLFYLAFALHHGLPGTMAAPVVEACLWTLALSIVLHGVSATPLMNRYEAWRDARRGPV